MCTRWPETLYFEHQKKGKISIQDLPEHVHERVFNVLFRLCANCIESPEGYGTCERDHLRKCFANKKKVKGTGLWKISHITRFSNYRQVNLPLNPD